MTMTETGTRTQRLTAIFLTAAMAATVCSALAFQYIGGYIPCKLCYEQRIPYYVGIPVMVVAVLASFLRLPAMVTRTLLVIGGLLMVF